MFVERTFAANEDVLSLKDSVSKQDIGWILS